MVKMRRNPENGMMEVDEGYVEQEPVESVDPSEYFDPHEDMSFDDPEYKPTTLSADSGYIEFSNNAGQVVTFHPDGVIEFGEKYKNNPDAAAREFIRIVGEITLRHKQNVPKVTMGDINSIQTLEATDVGICEVGAGFASDAQKVMQNNSTPSQLVNTDGTLSPKAREYLQKVHTSILYDDSPAKAETKEEADERHVRYTELGEFLA